MTGTIGPTFVAGRTGRAETFKPRREERALSAASEITPGNQRAEPSEDHSSLSPGQAAVLILIPKIILRGAEEFASADQHKRPESVLSVLNDGSTRRKPSCLAVGAGRPRDPGVKQGPTIMTPNSRTVVVTGAAHGIGRATALKFAAEQDIVFAADLRYAAESRADLDAAGVTCLTADVRNIAALEQVIQTALQTTSQLDVLVNNAGVGLVKQIDDVSEADWDVVMDTNLKAAFFGCKAAVSVMSQQPSGGSIINVASNAGILPRSHDPVYSISKMALVGLTKSLALCHSKDRIRINCVCPGPVENTQMIEENFVDRPDRQQVVRELIQASPLARAWDRMISPDEVADAILYLAGEGAKMVSGTAIAIDGGKSLGVPPG